MNLTELLQPLPFTTLTALAALSLLLPLLSFGLLLLFERFRQQNGHRWALTIFLCNTLLSAVILSLLWKEGGGHTRWQWFSIQAGDTILPFTIGISLNRLAGLMLLLVNFIALLVHVFSLRYMEKERGYNRYFAFLGLFTFAMLGIVLADNLFVIFIFWELVGFSSYLLIGFWYRKRAAVAASKKAFLVNRIGDMGFLLGMLVLYAQFGTLDLSALQELMPHSTLQGELWFHPFEAGSLTGVHRLPAYFVTLAGLGLFCGAIGKSAQFPLQLWLPDAMEGPTPVSALIHAATMVAAGVYLLARVFAFLTPEALNVIAFTGAVTAFMGAFAAFGQHDIKKVLAYSTISQLGYMVMGMGTGAYSAALFHLFTHAFFKACLFLTAGAVIYALHRAEGRVNNGFHFDVQDMRWMGGLRHKMPVTYATYIVAMLALAGLPFFSGFLSKDAILAGAWGWASELSSSAGPLVLLVPLLGFATALMTALYMGRQLVLVFFGENRLAKYDPKGEAIWQQVREVPWSMQLPLLLLGLLCLAPFFSLNPLNSESSWLLHAFTVPKPALPGSAVTFEAANRLYEIGEAAARYHTASAWLSVILALCGLLLAYLVYFLFNGRGAYYSPNAKPSGRLWRLSNSNWYLNELYQKTFIRLWEKAIALASWLDSRLIDPVIDLLGMGYVVFSHVSAWIDRSFVDGFIHSTVWLSGRAGQLSRSMQGGRIQTYLLLMVLGLLAVLFWMMG